MQDAAHELFLNVFHLIESLVLHWKQSIRLVSLQISDICLVLSENWTFWSDIKYKNMHVKMHLWSVLIYGWVYFGFVDIAELHLEAVKFVPKHKLKGSVFVHLYNTAFGQKQCNLNNVCVYIYKWVTLVLSQFEKKNILAVNSPEKMSMMFIYLVLKMVVVLIVLMTAHNLILKTKPLLQQPRQRVTLLGT